MRSLRIAVAALAGLAAAQDPVIRVSTTEVSLDLVVRDKNGRQVKNLKPADLEIYEDGVRQQLLGFRRVDGKQAAAAVQPAVPAQTAPGAVRPLKVVNTIAVVFHELSPVTRLRGIEAVQEFLKSPLPAETYVGLFGMDDRLIPVHPFTSNLAEVRDALQKAFSGRGLDFARASEPLLSASPNQMTVSAAVDMAGRGATVTMDVTGGEISPTMIVGADVATSPGANARRGDQVRERSSFAHISGMRGLDQMNNMIKQLRGLPGRKSVLLVTSGLTTTGEPDRFKALVDEAGRSGLTVFALDAQGLEDDNNPTQAGAAALGQVSSVSRSQGAVSTNLSAAREKSRQMDNLNTAVRASDLQASLRALSEGTGGFLIANSNDYRKPFNEIVDELGGHWSVTYRPTSTLFDGRLRNIEVKTTHPDWQVESRTGYFAIPNVRNWDAPLAYETTALALLAAKEAPKGFEFRSGVFHFRGDQSAIVVEIPGSSLAASADPARKTRKLHLSLLALVKNAANGQIVERFTHDISYEIPEANIEAARRGPITHCQPLKLPAGKYRLETVVIDQEGRRASSSQAELEIPERKKGVAVSDVLLVDRVEPVAGQPDPQDPLVYQGQRAMPMLDTRVKTGLRPFAYFVVYADPSSPAKPGIKVEFLVGGKVLASQTAELPPPDASGAIPMMVGAATAPGDCELRITAQQGADSHSHSVKYTVRP